MVYATGACQQTGRTCGVAGGGRGFYSLVAVALVLLAAANVALSPGERWGGRSVLNSRGLLIDIERAAATARVDGQVAVARRLSGAIEQMGETLCGEVEVTDVACALETQLSRGMSSSLDLPGVLGPSLLEGHQVIAYYGNPYTAQMGILGAHAPERLADLLAAHAERYDRLNASLDVLPAFHLVYAVAQDHPTENGRYLQYMAEEDVEKYVALADRRGFLLILDLQVGRGEVEEELARIAPYLRLPFVHVALDPEFAMSGDQVPGVHIGELDAEEINRAQLFLQRLVLKHGLPPKMLIVHQFLDSMVARGEAIERYPGVELVIDMDGFGPAEVKGVKYARFASRSYAQRAGIKLFFEHDSDLMTEAEVMSLQPRPTLVVYQ
jgi:hypothetical protein